MPMGYTFIQTIDMFIKVHKVFNLEFSKEIFKAMQFFEVVAYDIQDSKRFMTNRMEEVAKLLLDEIDNPQNADADGA